MIDTIGTKPEPRFGHTMTLLNDFTVVMFIRCLHCPLRTSLCLSLWYSFQFFYVVLVLRRHQRLDYRHVIVLHL